MKGIVLLLGVCALVSACGDKQSSDKKSEVCLSIVKSLVTNPVTLQVNEIKLKEYPLDEAALVRFQNEKFDGKVPPATVAYREMLLKDGVGLFQAYVTVDYTDKSSSQEFRDRALCHFVNTNSKYELSSVTIRNKDIANKDLLFLFVKYGRPAGLDLLNKVE
ncbi:hypothetical protein ACW9IO_25915 [Pseudomonas azotoformans]